MGQAGKIHVQSLYKLKKNTTFTTIEVALATPIRFRRKLSDSAVLNNVFMYNERPKIISLFSGAGGLDIGFEAAGFQTAVAVEIDTSCCETLRFNRPDPCVINKSISDVTGEEILNAAKIGKGEAALVIGGPPCQSFSIAGLRKGLDDERGKLLFEFVRIVRETLPVGFVLENVKGLANWDNGKAVELLLDELRKPIEADGMTYQYSVAKPQILNAADFDVPQYRERLIIVGNRLGKDFLYPIPELFARPHTVWDAIGFLPPPDAPSETALKISKTIKSRREKYGY